MLGSDSSDFRNVCLQDRSIFLSGIFDELVARSARRNHQARKEAYSGLSRARWPHHTDSIYEHPCMHAKNGRSHDNPVFSRKLEIQKRCQSENHEFSARLTSSSTAGSHHFDELPGLCEILMNNQY